MKYAAAIALGLSFLFSSAAAQDRAKKDGELTDGLEVLKKADEAVKTLKAVQYKASAKGLGVDEARMAAAEGKALLSGWQNLGPAKYRYEVKVKRPGSEDVSEYTAGCDGDITYLIDRAMKMVYADMDPAVLGSAARLVRAISVGKLVNPDGFADELKAEKVELKGSTQVGDVDCYEVHVTYGGDTGEGTWAIAKTDFLPRRIERSFPRPNGERGGRLVTLTDVVANPELPADSFKPVVPEGFKKTDDFAP